MTQYLNINTALLRAKERCQGKATSADDPWLREMLNMSAGTVGGVAHYRPYYCAAKLLEQKQSAQTISEADGAKFTGLALPIASLFDLQSAYDKANGVQVPAGFEAVTTGSNILPRLRSRSVSYSLRP